MEIKIYHTLPAEARQIRETVFVEEQHFQEEFDETDRRALHLVLYEEGKAAGTCRVFEGSDPGEYLAGRIAVLKPFRGRKFGSFLLKAAEDQVRKAGGKKIRLHAQQRAAAFYEKQGYTAGKIVEYEEYCPHIWMWKNLS